jgi:pyridoxal biosynthesis lyase PdxS
MNSEELLEALTDLHSYMQMLVCKGDAHRGGDFDEAIEHFREMEAARFDKWLQALADLITEIKRRGLSM